MIRTKIIFLLALLVITAIIFSSIGLLRYRSSVIYAKLRRTLNADMGLSRRIGEKITYNVTMRKIRLGQVEFNSLPGVEIGNKKLDLVTFETNIKGFQDYEKIYSDPQTFLPIRVERDIKKLIVTEKIVEDYDQSRFILVVTKTSGGREEQIVINNNSQIHNPVLLPYYIRRIPGLGPGWALWINLPRRKYLIKLVSIDSITVPAGTFRAYCFVSEPKQFEIWISADERRIPLKIMGVGIFAF